MSSKKAVAPLLVLLCLSLMSFKGINKRTYLKKKSRAKKEMAQKRFCYIKATMKNIEGDTYVYSEIVSFDARATTSQKLDILMEFEDELNKVYTENVIEVNFEDVVGEFSSKREARKSRSKAIQQISKDKKISREEMKIELLKRGETVRF